MRRYAFVLALSHWGLGCTRTELPRLMDDIEDSSPLADMLSTEDETIAETLEPDTHRPETSPPDVQAADTAESPPVDASLADEDSETSASGTLPDAFHDAHLDSEMAEADVPMADAVDPAAVCVRRTAPTGAAPGSTELDPGKQRLRAATSPDGLTWTRLPDTIVDQAATPSLTRTADGRPMLYMTAFKIDGTKDGTAVSIGSDDGRSWVHCRVELEGFPGYLLGADPDVVAVPGGYRLFVTGALGPGNPVAGIHYADSVDGIHWTYGGIALQRQAQTIDSMTLVIDGAWHQYALDGQSIAMVHATSDDGRVFTAVDSAQRLLDGKPQVLSHAARIGDTWRVFGFGPQGKEIRAFTTTDGATLVGDSRLLLSITGAPAPESVFVKDPAVTRLNDGTYLMVYSTVIP